MFEFDEKTHTYKNDGIIVPSVTQLIPKQDFHVSDDRLKECSAEGNVNHELIKLYFEKNRNTFGEPYLIAFNKFLHDNKNLFGEFVCSEKPLYSEKNRFAGTPDLIFANAIVDIKRGPGNKRYLSLQLSAYHLLAIQNKIIKKNTLWITAYENGGKFRMRNVYDLTAEQIFLGLVKKYWIDQATEKYFKN
jgi:hypothetical protein